LKCKKSGERKRVNGVGGVGGVEGIEGVDGIEEVDGGNRTDEEVVWVRLALYVAAAAKALFS